MEESFNLLSSMSPKVKNKSFKKGSTVLALKKHFRRSLIYDKAAPTITNDSLILVESSTTDSAPSSHRGNIVNKTPIVISDTESFDDDSEKSLEEKQVQSECANVHLLTQKRNDIEIWLSNVHEVNPPVQNVSLFSEISTILDDVTMSKLNKEHIAINSTFANSASKRFDELFKGQVPAVNSLPHSPYEPLVKGEIENKEGRKKNSTLNNIIYSNIEGSDHVYALLAKSEQNDGLKIGISEIDTVMCINDTKENPNDADVKKINDSLLVVEASFELNSDEDVKQINGSINEDTPRKLRDSKVQKLVTDNYFNTPVINGIETKNCKKVPKSIIFDKTQDKENSNLSKEMEFENILDSLYGTRWRIKKDIILSEPRKKTNNLSNHKNSERQHKKSKAPKLLNTLHTARMRKYFETPAFQNLRKLCDDDTDTDEENGVIKMHVRSKLNFDEDSDRENCNIRSKANKKMSTENKNVNNKPVVLKENCFISIESLGRLKTSKQSNCKSDKENVSDFSDFENETLELRIKKKISGSNISKNKDKNVKTTKPEPRLQKKTLSFGSSSPPYNKKTENKNGSDFSDFENDPLELRVRKKISGSTTRKNKDKKVKNTKSEPSIMKRRSRSFDSSSPTYNEKLENENVSDSSDFQNEPLELRVQKKGTVQKFPKTSKNENQNTKLKKQTRKSSTSSSSSSQDIRKTSGISKAKTPREKSKKPLEPVVLDESDSSSEEEWDRQMENLNITRKETKPTKGYFSFLASLSGSVPLSKCDMSARIFRNNFMQYRNELHDKLFKMYNEKIFANSLPKDTQIEWSDKMRKTAGFCYCNKITRRTGAIERSARIVLSTKVCDSADRLRDTLIHEMCHAAAWVIDQVNNGHGVFWRNWASRAMTTFPELPPIKRCHDYVINTKYTYKCLGCGYSIGRHSKSLDIERKRCGHCYGKFEILINKVTKKGDVKVVAATPKKEATGFALFVKENYAVYKNPGLNHGDVMKLLGQKFSNLKLKQN